jgi:hypothetical protein
MRSVNVLVRDFRSLGDGRRRPNHRHSHETRRAGANRIGVGRGLRWFNLDCGAAPPPGPRAGLAGATKGLRG